VTDALRECLTEYEAVRGAIDSARRRLRGNPFSEDANELCGFTRSDRDRRARQRKLDVRFDGIKQNLFGLYLLKLVTLFEVEVKKRLPTKIDLVRKTVERDLPAFGAELVTSADDYQNLADFERLFTGAQRSKLKELRDERNHVAHGSALSEGQTFATLRDVYDALVELLSALG